MSDKTTPTPTPPPAAIPQWWIWLALGFSAISALGAITKMAEQGGVAMKPVILTIASVCLYGGAGLALMFAVASVVWVRRKVTEVRAWIETADRERLVALEYAHGAESVAEAAKTAATRAEEAARAASEAVTGVTALTKQMEVVPRQYWMNRQMEWLREGRSVQVRVDQPQMTRNGLLTFTFGILHFGGLTASGSELSLNGLTVNNHLIGPVTSEADKRLPLPGWRPMTDNWAFFLFRVPMPPAAYGTSLERVVQVAWASGAYRLLVESVESDASLPSGNTIAVVEP